MENFFKSLVGRGLVVVLIALVIGLTYYFLSNEKKVISTKTLTISGILLAVGTVTNHITVYSFPQGGSVTLFSMFFIAYIGYLLGLKIGILSAITYGLLNLLIKPSVYHPAQIVVDYILAFGALGLSGLFSNKNSFIYGYIIAVIGRLLFSVISGYVFFGQYAPEGWNPLWYSFVYNISYIGVEAVITIFIILIPVVSEALNRVKKMNYK